MDNYLIHKASIKMLTGGKITSSVWGKIYIQAALVIAGKTQLLWGLRLRALVLTSHWPETALNPRSQRTLFIRAFLGEELGRKCLQDEIIVLVT